MRVSKKGYGMILGISISLVMSVVMSFFMMWINAGFFPGFIFAWIKSIGIGLVVGVPIGAIAIPLIQKGLNKMFTVE